VTTRNGYREEAYISFSYTPVRDDEGEVVGMFCACTETTEQVKARAVVTAEKDRFGELFQQAPSFMAPLRGPDHVIEFANPGFIRPIGYRDAPMVEPKSPPIDRNKNPYEWLRRSQC
jgi:PAS domain-containing protein